MPSNLRFRRQLALVTLFLGSLPPICRAQTEPIKLATHNQARPAATQIDRAALARIKHIILNQGEDARALANLVQLTRTLPPAATAQLYDELATEYLQLGRYNQAANVLQQLLNQHLDQPLARDALLRLMQLYSSSEVALTQDAKHSDAAAIERQQGYLRYSQYLVGDVLQRDKSLSKDPAIAFQRAVTARLAGASRLAQARLTQLKHQRNADIWRELALTEQWLPGSREEAAPRPTVTCRATDRKPHLDGLLDDSLWQQSQPVQFAYDDEFLYLAITQPKVAGQTYAPSQQPRTHDADLDGHDRVEIHLDADRDLATCLVLTVDHQGRTHDRCWLDASWNPQWFVAAAGDATHWTIEAAIAWDQLTRQPPQPGDAWAIATKPLSAADSPTATAATPTPADFQLLLFQ